MGSWPPKQFQLIPIFLTKVKQKKKKLKHSLRTNFNKLQKNFLKEKMIDKIKSFKKKKNKKQKVENQSSDEYTNAFDFMEDIVKKRKTKKHNNQRIKSKLHIETDIRNPDIRDSERSFIKPDPPYGILKKGKKQLYSKYRKSLKNNTLAFTDSNRFGKELDINQEIINIKNNNFLSENIHNRKQKLENLKNKFLKNN